MINQDGILIVCHKIEYFRLDPTIPAIPPIYCFYQFRPIIQPDSCFLSELRYLPFLYFINKKFILKM